MTLRAVVLGVLLGLFVVGATYFNDQVIRQTYLIGNHLPAIVFGAGLLIVLVLNPLLGVVGLRRLGAAEVAVVVALGLAVCGWPGSNLLRYFSGVVSKPAVVEGTKPAWKSQAVMSYLPGGSALLAEGYVTDWPAFTEALRGGVRAGEGAGRTLEEAARARIIERLASPTRRALLAGAGRGAAGDERRIVLTGVNDVLRQRGVYEERFAPLVGSVPEGSQSEWTDSQVQHVNRALLTAAFPRLVRPAPAGEGLLLNGGAPSRAVDLIVSGRQTEETLSPLDVPWADWWPVLRLWIGASLLVGLASLCLVVVVHPQWAGRELLPYPTVRFVEEVSANDGGGWLPNVARHNLFWLGFVLVIAAHTLNGLNVWFPLVPTFVRTLGFHGLGDLFPNARRVPGSWGMLGPTIYFTVIGFGFLIPTRVSFSLGLSSIAWLAFGAFLLGVGLPLEEKRFDPGSRAVAMRAGSYIGLTLMILYYGRRYYWGVAKGTVGLMRSSVEVPRESIWAARLMVLCLIACVGLISHYGGLSLPFAVLLVVGLMIVQLVLTRVNVETGLFYAQPDFLVGVLLAGIFGVTVIGPEALIVLTLASVVLMADPREAVAPYLANGLRMSQRVGGASVKRAAWALAAMLTLGLIVGLVTTLTIQYNLGLNPHDAFANRDMPAQTFDNASRALADMSAARVLGEATGRGGWEAILGPEPERGVLPWMALGVTLVLVCGAARVRLPWWPIHPVLFIVWGTYPMSHFAFSFLLAAVTKWAVVRLGGIRAFHAAMPLMIGFIAAELLAVLGWSVVGAIYYAATGLTPLNYRIFPS